MSDIQALREGIASLNRTLDGDEFQEQIAKELLYLQNFVHERRQLLESLHTRCSVYKELLERIGKKIAEPLINDENKSLLKQGAAIIADDLEALESGILTIERELTVIETKRAAMVFFDPTAPKDVDLSLLDSNTLKQLKANIGDT